MAAFHCEELQKFCRVCGKRLSRNRVNFNCQQHADILASTFGFLISDDNPEIHPKLLCHGCYSVLRRSKKAAETRSQYQPSINLFKWTAHSLSQCEMCQHFQQVSCGGRPKKTRNTGRPPSVSFRTAIDHIRSIAPPSFFPVNTGVSVVVPSEGEVSLDLVCCLCSKLLHQPVQLTTCNSLVCMSCLCRHLEKCRELMCPCCSTDHLKDFKTIIPPSAIVVTILGNQKINCPLCKNKIASGTLLYT